MTDEIRPPEDSGLKRRPTVPYIESQEGAAPPLQPKKFSGLKKAGKIVGWSAASILGLGALSIGFLHTPPGQSFLRGQIEKALSKNYDGVVTLGEVDFTLFGDIELKDLKISEHSGRTVVHLKSARVSPEWGSLTSSPTLSEVEVDGVALDLEAYPDGTTNLKRMQKKQAEVPKKLAIRSLKVGDVDVRLKQPDGLVQIDDLSLLGELALDKEAGLVSATLRNYQASLQIEKPTLQLTTDLKGALVATHTPESTQVKLTPEASTLKVTREGQTQTLPLLLGALGLQRTKGQIDFSLDATELGPLSIARIQASGPENPLDAKDSVLSGNIEGLRLSKDKLHVLSGREILATDLQADLALKGPRDALALNGKVQTEGGTLNLESKLNLADLAKPIYTLALKGDGIATDKLLANPNQDPRPRIATSFASTFSGEGLPNQGGFADLDLNVGETLIYAPGPDGAEVVRKVDGIHVQGDYRDETVRLKGIELRALGQVATLSGQVHLPSRSLEAKVTALSKLDEAIKEAEKAKLAVTLPPLEGQLEVDIGIKGKLKPEADIPKLLAAQAQGERPKLAELPIADLEVKGFAKGERLAFFENTLGLLDFKADVRATEPHLDSLKGQVALKVADLKTAKTTLDSLDATIDLEGAKQRTTLVAKDQKQGLDANITLKSLLKPEQKGADLTLEKVDVKRGAIDVSLKDPVTISVSAPVEGQDQHLRLPETTLNMARGEVTLSGDATLRNNSDTGKPEVVSMQADVDLQRVDLQRLAAMARKPLRNVSGTLTGRAHVSGTPTNPEVNLVGTVQARAFKGEPTRSKVDLRLANQRLNLSAQVSDGKPVLNATISAPIHLKPKPGLSPNGRLSVNIDLPRSDLARIRKLVPHPALAQLGDKGHVEGKLKLEGSAAAPQGSYSFEVEGPALRQKNPQAPETQKLAVRGDLSTLQGQVSINQTLQGWVDAKQSPTLQHHLSAAFGRSPLLGRALERPWSVQASLSQPLQLSDLSQAKVLSQPASGQITHSLHLSGQKQDLKGEIQWAGQALRLGDAPEAALNGTLSIQDQSTKLDQRIQVAGLDALKAHVDVGLPGKGLLSKTKRGALPLSGLLEVVEQPLAQWKRALKSGGKDLPGVVGGQIVLSGTTQVPQAKGEIAWHRFTSLAGTPGKIALTVDASASTIGGGLQLSPSQPLHITAQVPREALSKSDVLPVSVKVDANQVDVRTLVPEGVLAPVGKATPITLAGVLNSDLGGTLFVERAPKSGLNPQSALAGSFALTGLDLAVHDTDRHLRNGELTLVAQPDGLHLKRLAVEEKDLQRQDRSLEVSGVLGWQNLVPTHANFKAKTHKFLFGGQGFDGPEGELDLDATLALSQISATVKQVDITVNELGVYAPDRLIRAHYPQFVAYNDLITVSDTQPKGRLTKPKALAIAAPTAADMDKGGADVKLRIPNPAHIIFAAASPIELKLQGGMDVTVRGQAVGLKGKIDILDGSVNAMGIDFPLQHGAITADGGIDTALAEMYFARKVKDSSLRDVAEGEHSNLATITVRATAKTGLQTIFGGVSGPYLLDMSALMGTGVMRLHNAPDSPTSGTVRFGNPEQGLINSFVQTNLRHLIFMDRAEGWAEALDTPETYGQLRHFDMQRFLRPNQPTSEQHSRIRFKAQPLDIAKGPFELGYEWLLVNQPRAVLGFGPWLDFDLRAGLGFNWEWSSRR